MNFLNIKSLVAHADGSNVPLTDASCRTESGHSAQVYYIKADLKDSVFNKDCAVSAELDISGSIKGWMANYLYCNWWCRPEFGTDFGNVPDKTQGLLWQYTDGTWGFVLPFCGDEYTCYLTVHDGRLCADVCSFYGKMSECNTPAFIYKVGDDPYHIIRDCAETAAELSGIKLREERSYPEIFDYLGWCSWDAMEIWVDEEGLLQKCREFRDKNVPVRWAIIDDMWADIAWTEKLPKFTPHSTSIPVMHASKMRNYKADPERFPHGLDGCIGAMKEYGLKIGIWHPTTGYWAGLEPDSEADRKLKPYTRVMESGWILPDLTDRDKAYGFYSTLHRYFRQCGADFVKVDNQSFLRSRYEDVAPIGVLAENLHYAIERSVNENFDGAVINCMGMANDNMFHRHSSDVSRCSNDFVPERRAWFAKHLLQCSYNGLIQGQFNTCDWDMWWTDDTQAEKNSVLRAVSGGPIYVSDRIARTNPEILKPLCFADGKILRCDGVAVPSSDDLCRNPLTSGKAFSVLNSIGENVVVASFNINESEESVDGSIVPSDYGITQDCILYEYFSVTAVYLHADEAYKYVLKNNDEYKLFTLLPKKGKRTVIGLVNKMISPAAIVASDDNSVTLYEAGTLAWFDDRLHTADTNGNVRYYF
ncbi:MAG: Sip1-related alpha-galactosidase [Eubacteriales bacterium]